MERFTKKSGLDFTDKNLSLANELGYSYIYNHLAELENKVETGQLKEVKNEPLTLEEMKSLEPGDWVWFLDIFESGGYSEGEYLSIRNQGHSDAGEEFDSVAFDGRQYSVYRWYKYYGKQWIAYKNKEQAQAKLKELEKKK